MDDLTTVNDSSSEGVKADSDTLGSLEDVAERFGKSVRTIYRWRDRGMPMMENGRFDVAAIEVWLQQKKGMIPPGVNGGGGAGSGKGKHEGTGEGDGGAQSGGVDGVQGKDWWDKENKKFQAQLRELELRKRFGELIEFKRVEEEFVTRILSVKAGLLAFERSLPPELIACRTEREMSDVIRKSVRALLEGFARPLPPSMQPEGGDNGQT